MKKTTKEKEQQPEPENNEPKRLSKAGIALRDGFSIIEIVDKRAVLK